MTRPQAKPMMDTIWDGFFSSNFFVEKKVCAEAFIQVAQFAWQWCIWRMRGGQGNMVEITMAIGPGNLSSSRYDLHVPDSSKILLMIITHSAQWEINTSCWKGTWTWIPGFIFDWQLTRPLGLFRDCIACFSDECWTWWKASIYGMAGSFVMERRLSIQWYSHWVTTNIQMHQSHLGWMWHLPPKSARKVEKKWKPSTCCNKQILKLQPNVIEQRSLIQETIEAAGHLCLFSKMTYWVFLMKKYLHDNCDYSFNGLEENYQMHWMRYPYRHLPLGTLAVSLDGSLLGRTWGSAQAQLQAKKFSSRKYKSHRCIPENTATLFNQCICSVVLATYCIFHMTLLCHISQFFMIRFSNSDYSIICWWILLNNELYTLLYVILMHNT